MPTLRTFSSITRFLRAEQAPGVCLRHYSMKTFIENNNLPNTTILLAISVLSEAFKTTDLSNPHYNGIMQSNCIAAMREIQRFLVFRDQGYPFLELKGNKEISKSLSDKRMPFDASI